MEAYAESVGDAFDPAREMLEQIVAQMRGARLRSGGHGDLEEFLQVEGRALQLALLQGSLDEMAAAEVRVRGGVSGPDGLGRPRVEVGRTRNLVTVFGTAVVSRMCYRAAGLTNVYPLDAVLDLPVSSSFSRGITRLAVIEGVRGSFAEAGAAIERATGVVVGTRQLRELVGAAAADIEAFHTTAKVPEAQVGDALMLTFDGKGIVMRTPSLRPKTAKAAAASSPRLSSRVSPGEKTGRKRMAELACVYDIACEPRTGADLIPVTAAETKAAAVAAQAAIGAKRPKATHRWLNGSLVDSIPTMVAAGFAQADRRDRDHDRAWVALVDGNAEQIAAITAEAAARNLHVPIVIDFIHVAEYIWSAAWVFFDKDDLTVEGWVASMLRKVLDGKALQVATEIEEYATRYNFTTAQRRNADKAVTYLTRHAEHLDYPTALTKGWPIATGVIEGACRHLPID